MQESATLYDTFLDEWSAHWFQNISKRITATEYVKCISSNNNITIKTILDNPDFNWNFWDVSFNENITPAIIKKHIKLPWNLSMFWFNENCMWKYLTTGRCENVDFKGFNHDFTFSKHPHLSWNIIQKNK